MSRVRYLRRLERRHPGALAASAALATELAKGEPMPAAADPQKINALVTSMVKDAHALADLVREVAVEPPPREIAPLIVQLADVTTEIAEHLAKYAGKPRTIRGAYSCEAEETEWRILHRRHTEIVEGLERYAVAACGRVPSISRPANETQSGWTVASSARTP